MSMATLAATKMSEVGLQVGGSNLSTYSEARNFDFNTKLKFDSSNVSAVRRSELYVAPEKPYVYNIWTLRPPNFNPQAFEPRPIGRNTREAIQPWKYDRFTTFKSGTAPTAAMRRSSDKRLTEYMKQLRQGSTTRAKSCGALETRSEFKVRFRIADPYQARVDFVKNGMYPAGEYKTPQPHDFRQYPPLKVLGLDEFVTSYDHDCGGIKKKSEGLRTLMGPPVDVLRHVPFPSKSEYESPRHLQWDPQLILPKLSFPNKNAAFTRHRRNDRSARSAYLERAEAMLEKRAEEIKVFKDKFLEKANRS